MPAYSTPRLRSLAPRLGGLDRHARYRRIHGRLRGVDEASGGHLREAAREETRQDGRRGVPVSAGDLVEEALEGTPTALTTACALRPIAWRGRKPREQPFRTTALDHDDCADVACGRESGDSHTGYQPQGRPDVRASAAQRASHSSRETRRADSSRWRPPARLLPLRLDGYRSRHCRENLVSMFCEILRQSRPPSSKPAKPTSSGECRP